MHTALAKAAFGQVRSATRARLALLALLGFHLLLSGCFSPSLYQTPRTLTPGNAAGVLGLEPTNGIGDSTSRNASEVDRRPTLTPAFIVPALVFVARYGLASRVELSGSVLLATSASGSVMGKFQLVRNPYLDIALMPRLSGGWFKKFTGPYGSCGGEYCSEVFHAEASAIALFGLNLGDDVTLVAAPGLVQSLTPHGRRGFRLTLGVQVRISKELAIHPEVTYMPAPLGLNSATGGWFGGLGFVARGPGDGYAK